MALLVVLLVPLLLPAVLVAIAPANSVRAVAGWAILLAGLLGIDNHAVGVAPYDDDMMAGFGGLFVWTWVVTIGLVLAARHEVLLDPWQAEGAPKPGWARDWTLPISILGGVTFLHWLSNRLAGATPAALVHLAVYGSASCVAGLVAWRSGWRARELRWWQRLVVATSFVVALLVVCQAAKGFDLWFKARRQAKEVPHCIVTHAGIERSREAHSAWELSPLVNRRYGIWAPSKGPVLVVTSESGISSYRRFDGRWRKVSHGRPLCRPRQ